MAKENLVPCSTRLDKDTIERIDEFVSKHRYWKRNSVINGILGSVMNGFLDKEIYDMVRRNSFKDEPISCHYQIV